MFQHKTRMRGALVAVLATATLLAGCSPKPAGPPNVVLITLESLRTDHVTMMDGTRPTTPSLDALAAEGVVYENAYAVTSWTLASHASLFTGLYPTAHQTTGPRSKLDRSYTTIAEVLRSNGYQSAAVVSGPYLRREYNLTQGFDHFFGSPSELTPRSHTDVTNPKMETQLKRLLESKRDASRPLFLFAYYWDIHYDYIPPEPYDEMFVEPHHEPIDMTRYEAGIAVHPGMSDEQMAYVLSQYDGEIRWTDDHLGRLFEMLKREGLWDNTLIIVTADHGEEFYDHGMKGHKKNLYEETIHVPLVIKYPKSEEATVERRGRDSRLTSHVDILPTILEVTGTSSDLLLHGRSLLAAPRSVDEPIFNELLSVWWFPIKNSRTQEKKEEEWSVIRSGNYKLISAPSRDLLELYDIDRDPLERSDLSTSEDEKVREMTRTLEEWKAAMQATAEHYTSGGDAELDQQSLERLRSLGYIQ